MAENCETQQLDARAETALADYSNSGTENCEEIAFEQEYAALKKWFGCRMSKRDWDEDAVRLGALMVYGWMPTMLRVYGRGPGPLENCPRNLNWDGIISKLNGGDPRSFEADRFLNNSFVGTSKFLHFCWPEYFAIWDRNVHVALELPGGPNNRQDYLSYQRWIRDFRVRKGKSIREVETALFRLGKELKSKKGRGTQNGKIN